MPTWSSLQSLIQLGVAINAAIFAVAALREPLVAREREASSALDRRHDLMRADARSRDDPNWAPFHSSYLKARAALVDSEKWIESWDRRIQRFAGAAALVSVVALVRSAYVANDELGPLGVAFLTLFTVGPSLLAVVFNAYTVSRKLDDVRRLRNDAETCLADLMTSLEAGGTSSPASGQR